MSSTRPPLHVEQVRTLDEKYLANSIVFETMIGTAAIILDGSGLRRPDGELDRSAIRDRIERLSWSIPAFRQRLIDAPLRIVAPAWVPVDDIDLQYHVRFHPERVPDDPSNVELLTGRGLPPLDIARPLWAFNVLDLESGRVALIARFHHVMGDAMYGLAIGDVLAPARVVDPLPPVSDAERMLIGRAPRTRIGAFAHLARRWWRERESPADALRTLRRRPLRRRLRRWAARLARPIRDRRALARGARAALPAKHSRYLHLDLPSSIKRAYRWGGTLNDLTVALTLIAILDITPTATEAALLVPISHRKKGDEHIRNHTSVVRVAIPAGTTLDAAVRSVRAQVQHSVDTGEDAITTAGDWSGYATYVTWGGAIRHFGSARVDDFIGWPAGEPYDDVACLSCSYAKTLTLSVTANRSTDIDAIMASIERTLAESVEVSR